MSGQRLTFGRTFSNLDQLRFERSSKALSFDLALAPVQSPIQLIIVSARKIGDQPGQECIR